MPEATKNKVKYGLSKCYYAVATIAADGTATFGAPKALPGAVSLSLDAQGEITPFRADNMDYWISSSNNGYEGDLEIAIIPEEFKADVLNEYEDTTQKVFYETTDADPTHFALLFQFEGDVHATRHVLYNCVATRPQVSGETTPTGGVEPQTETISVTASSIYNAGLQKSLVKASSKSDTTTGVYNGWFSAVTVPTSATT